MTVGLIEMTTWTGDELDRIGGAEELDLASRRRDDGTLRSYVTIWVVRAGDELYVRSAHGPDNPWYHACSSQRRRPGSCWRRRADVTFADPAPDMHGDIDAAYHAKYDRYGPRIVGTVVGPDAHPVTIRLSCFQITSRPEYFDNFAFRSTPRHPPVSAAPQRHPRRSR